MPPKLHLRANWHTLAMIAMLVAMWYAAEAQSNGAAYLLALLAGLLTVVSMLHARANLRGLRLRVRSTSTAKEGGLSRVRLEVRNEGPKEACGVEIQVIEGADSVFVDRLEAGQCRVVELLAPAAGTLRFLARSVYPLGLYNMELVMETSAPRRVHARAAGSLPLPAPQPLGPLAQQQAAVSRSSARGTGRGGDDFAGTREFQPGDSTRHIDWRAVARGRPLVVKTWASDVSELVVLEWDAMPLESDARAGQLVRWMEMCESEERLYELRLPGKVIAAGRGHAHHRRCLDALADFTASQAAETQARGRAAMRQGRGKVRSGFESSSFLPHGPLVALSVGLVASFLPLIEVITIPCLVLTLLCFAWRLLLRKEAPPLAVRLIMLLAGMAAAWIGYAGQASMEAGIALLAALAGVKLLESRAPREFQVLALIGWFLCLCGIVMDNSLPRMLWCLGVFLLIAACMTRFRLSVPGVWRPARTTALMFAQALPLVGVLFVVMPRGLLNLTATFGGRFMESGIASELDPGSITKVALRMERAFRAEFPEGGVPPNDLRYWRCLTLADCEGLRWKRGERFGLKQNPARPAAGESVRQELQIEPHGQRWLPALDVPQLVLSGGAALTPEFDDALVSPFPVRGLTRVTIFSRLQQRTKEPLPAHHRAIYLDHPQNLTAETYQLAEDWKDAAENDLQIVQLGIRHLQASGFQYTLTPDEYGSSPEGLHDFLFRGKNGFCEHFAASFATLMRLAGVPSRVVIGFLGGEYSARTGQMIVRQSDAHAWVEVWLEGTGWTRLDPTAALAPGRVGVDMRAYLSSDGAAMERERLGWWGLMVFETRLFWDRVNYAWQDAVVEYNQEFQRSWLASLGWESGTWWQLLLISLGCLMVGLVLINLLLRCRSRERDPWRGAWSQLCQQLARTGYPACRACEGPLGYVQRIAPDNRHLQALAHLYAEGRYGSGGATLADFRSLLQRLRAEGVFKALKA
ncbi:MAG: transglutaminaseTgpA domain-containing protein [Prosthecobacter sp.]|jgi:uncharacterized protein (DUF58 family)